jgi:hypothetical protein
MAGESLRDYTSRLYGFCGVNIEAAFTGDPRNIVLVNRWSRVFAAAAEEMGV